MPEQGERTTLQRVPVWDLAVRLVHWAVVVLVGLSWWTAETGRMELHTQLGQVTLALVLFRILWGFFGSASARFSAFVRGPGAARAYLVHMFARRPSGWAGHNPLGGWSVLALIALLLAQTLTGLFAVDVDAINSGPLNGFVSFETGRAIAEVHEVLFTCLQILVVLHVAVIAFYAIWKREDLIGAMITGRKLVAPDAPRPVLEGTGRALVLLVLSAGLVWLVANYAVKLWVAIG